MTRIAIFAFLLSFAVTEARACGSQAEPCKVALGDYHAAVPTMAAKPGEKRSAVLFFHGAGGRGDAVLDTDSSLRRFVEAGYVVLGPNGLIMEGSRYGSGWSFRPMGRSSATKPFSRSRCSTMPSPASTSTASAFW